jgi:hypothetical protein
MSRQKKMWNAEKIEVKTVVTRTVKCPKCSATICLPEEDCESQE